MPRPKQSLPRRLVPPQPIYVSLHSTGVVASSASASASSSAAATGSGSVTAVSQSYDEFHPIQTYAVDSFPVLSVSNATEYNDSDIPSHQLLDDTFTRNTPTTHLMTHAGVTHPQQTHWMMRAQEANEAAAAAAQAAEAQAQLDAERVRKIHMAAAAANESIQLDTAGRKRAHPTSAPDTNQSSNNGGPRKRAKKGSSKSAPQQQQPEPQHQADEQFEVERLLCKRIEIKSRRVLKNMTGEEEETIMKVCQESLKMLVKEEEASMKGMKHSASSSSSSSSSASSSIYPLYTLLNPTLQLPLVTYLVHWKGWEDKYDSYEPTWNIHKGVIEELEKVIQEEKEAEKEKEQKEKGRGRKGSDAAAATSSSSRLIIHAKRRDIDAATLKSHGYNERGEWIGLPAPSSSSSKAAAAATSSSSKKPASTSKSRR